LISSAKDGLNETRIAQLAQEISESKKGGREIILVSSGAIISGLGKLGLTERPKSIPVKQAAAAVGQSRLMWVYEKTFGAYDERVAQILLTHDDLSDRRRFLNARNTLMALLKFGVIPIINENDTVATDEIKFGDNDRLAGMVAHLLDAHLLVILSDVDGLFTKDPRLFSDAVLVPRVTEVTPSVLAYAGGSSNEEGTGGMNSKMLAAKQVAEYGVGTWILNGTISDILSRAFQGEELGTEVLASDARLPSRKHWIAYTLKPKGKLVLDAGAVEAVQKHGKSLLPSGIMRVDGKFEPGDAVGCLDVDGKEIAKGLVNFSSAEIDRIKGAKSNQIRQILGRKDYDEIIHRDNLVLL
jgi:glutamate 5-kinase